MNACLPACRTLESSPGQWFLVVRLQIELRQPSGGTSSGLWHVSAPLSGHFHQHQMSVLTRWVKYYLIVILILFS